MGRFAIFTPRIAKVGLALRRFGPADDSSNFLTAGQVAAVIAIRPHGAVVVVPVVEILRLFDRHTRYTVSRR